MMVQESMVKLLAAKPVPVAEVAVLEQTKAL
jgi:hypothetical protein